MSVHTYVTGNKFHNIFGGMSDSLYGYITHITELTPMMRQRWPWLKNKWSLADHKFTHGHFDTLREAKAYAREVWPDCGFKTPAQFRREK
jgi:hypothetical protein